MLSFTEQRNLYGKLTNNESPDNLILGDTLITSETKRLIAKIGGNLLETEAAGTTVANKQTYPLPNKVKKLRGVTVTDGTTVWPVTESPSLKHWNELNSSGTSYTSDIPVWYRISGRKIKFWPIFASSANVITYNFDKRVVENTIADYTIGSIGTATGGTTTIMANTASGTTTAWTDSMNGRFILINKANNANTGDGEWYEISNITNATTLILATPYEGQNIVNGTAVYTIGEVSPLPDGFHELPVYRAAEIYWGKNDQIRAGLMKVSADRLENELLGANLATENVIAEDFDKDKSENPNFYIRSTNQ